MSVSLIVATCMTLFMFMLIVLTEWHCDKQFFTTETPVTFSLLLHVLKSQRENILKWKRLWLN